jgi:MFS superfamily sulfate permease-like transporter
MNDLGSVHCLYGLLANRTAAVVGATIVAILLGPIAAAALALVQGEQRDFWAGVSTLLVGALCVVGTVLLLGFIHSDIPQRVECEELDFCAEEGSPCCPTSRG